MDIWSWVLQTEARLRKEGHGRLADLVDRIPTEVCNDQHARVDALFPEALALAKSLQLPWVELFLRHWWLQSRVLHRMDGTALGEAVSLVEFAHREDTRECPQGVCAVQDLAACYGFVDGPGYADDRLAVAEETLSRIDETWPCFTCITSEWASAMRAKGDVEKALAAVDRAVAKLEAKGDDTAIFDFPRDRVEALIELGRFEEALAFVDAAEQRGRKDAHHRLSRRIDRARLLARLGRMDEAARALPEVSEVVPTPLFYSYWVDAARLLIEAGVAPNDASIGRVLQSFVDRLERQGVGRTTLELAEIHGRLALARGAPHVARRALATMERASKVLRRPLDALDRIARLRRDVERAPSVDAGLPDTPEALLQRLESGSHDPEQDLLVLEAACARWPERIDLALAHANALTANGMIEEAIERLDALHRARADEGVALRLGDLLLDRRDAARLERLAGDHRARAEDPRSASIADWLLAREAYNRGAFRDCVDRLDRVIEARAEAVNARRMQADAAIKSGDAKKALQRLDEVIERLEEPGPWDWDRMVAATLAGDHEKVRASAKRLGIELASEEGPIEERWGLCRVRYDDDEGTTDAWSVRTGPVTARVVQIARPPRRQRFGDVVVFDAQPLNPPSDDERDEKHVFVYPFVATLSEGKYRAFEVDGVHPGDATIAAIDAALSEIGCELQILSDERYVLEIEDRRHRGMFALLAVPHDCAPSAVHAALSRATEGAKHPLTWLELAEAAGDRSAVEAHAAAIAALGLRD